VTRSISGVMSRHFDDLDAILEFDALDELWQLIFSFQSLPCFAVVLTSLNTMSLAVFADSAPFVLTDDVDPLPRCARSAPSPSPPSLPSRPPQLGEADIITASVAPTAQPPP
jgi:hypothetical protein